MKTERAFAVSFLAFALAVSLTNGLYAEGPHSIQIPAADVPPAPRREFRGLWVATVNNVDWPSRPGLTTQQQQSELIAILDGAVALRLNAIILQVRPDCDALYESEIEPWSEYLTGTMGHAPFPYYDPLDFAVREAHKRGLELHAWINPFRVRSLDHKGAVAHDFITHRHPEMVRRYGHYLWLDPALAETRAYTLSVIKDIVHRYDIDGFHLDDYFYPYREKANNKDIDFPDSAAWARYRAEGGKLARNDWRRHNIDQFVEAAYTLIKREKPWVKFGVSPFGIWRPQNPPQVKGLDAYDVLFADSRQWLQRGWLDYLAPQLYWPMDAKDQSFSALLKWWTEQNPLRRHLWPGMKIGDWRGLRDADSAREVAREIQAIRTEPGAAGLILWHARPLLQNLGGVASALSRDINAEPALVPASPWLDSTSPPPPRLNVKIEGDKVRLDWKSGSDRDPWQWVLEKKVGEHWLTEIYPGSVTGTFFIAPEAKFRPSAMALAAVDRCGALSPWAFGLPKALTPGEQAR